MSRHSFIAHITLLEGGSMRLAGERWVREAFGVDDLGSDAPAGADRWARAVALGAGGRAANARAVLGELDPRSPILQSLAASTRGSLVRQSGRHSDARVDDGRACATAVSQNVHATARTTSPMSAYRLRRGHSADGDDLWAKAAWLDGLIGLAADNLGIGAFAASHRLLTRVGDELESFPVSATVNWVTIPRVALRHAWVRTEHALYSGDAASSSVWATRADELAAGSPSPRHRIKTDLIGAAVDSANGRLEVAVARARDVEKRCAERRLLPLQWAAATMLAGIDPADVGASHRASDLLTSMSFLGMSFATGA
ncbi:hypothetical protein [Gordonia malaquae]|uniref:hypothetical protein n=1 Tax=Gordonia malaquae TaxID=410332 RepID=UPI00301A1D19